jgi:glycosyltransferase involved in cell wall biosynthesis
VTIDILMPYWGDPDHMRAAVASVIAQTDRDWRMTVVDDCYPDPWLGPWLDELADDRIAFHRNETNRGITENYRTCLSHATEDVVVFMGCDDVMLPNYVGTIRAAHAAFPHADVIQPGVRVIDEDGELRTTLADTVKQRLTTPRVRGRRLLAGEELAASLLRADWMYWPSLAFSRERLLRTPFRDDFPLIQDLALVVDIVRDGGSLVLDTTDSFRYRRHSASASSSTLIDGRRFAGERRYFALAAAQMRALGWRRAERAARLHLTSRLHALALAPRVLATRDREGLRKLAAHALARSDAA